MDAQVRNPVRGDWAQLVKEDLQELGLNLTFSEVGKMSGNTLKTKLKTAVTVKAFEYLSEVQQKHSKSKNIQYSELKLQEYLRSHRSGTINEKARLFQIRSRMLQLKSNFKTGQENIMCTLCEAEEETQTHLLICPVLSSNSVISDCNIPVYEDIYSEDANRVEAIGRILMEKYELWKEKQNPDARNIVNSIVSYIIGAAAGLTSSSGI